MQSTMRFNVKKKGPITSKNAKQMIQQMVAFNDGLSQDIQIQLSQVVDALDSMKKAKK
ncbi:hypothetical protein MP228_002817 [Amoeboaphelidium protococcarum]|nr:hypothetical protein MP228_002817 [Amoeboaphelidium protococcarum]